MLQLAVALLVGLVFLVLGRSRGDSAAAAGAVWWPWAPRCLSARAFGGLGGAGVALGRLLSGMILKWVVILGGLVVILVQFKLPPLAAIAGLMAAYAVNLLAFRFKG